jgi:hypothetical protein
MSVTHFIPSGLRPSRSVKPHAVPVTLRFTPPSTLTDVVTARRPRPVGAPTARPGGRTSRLSPIAAEAVSTGLEILTSLERRTREVAREFRWNRIESGRQGLVDLVHSTQALVTLATTTATALGEDLDLSAEASGFSAAESTRHVIGRLIAGQARGDWHAVATTLERGFPLALAAWRTVFDTFSSETTTVPTDDHDPSGHAA